MSTTSSQNVIDRPARSSIPVLGKTDGLAIPAPSIPDTIKQPAKTRRFLTHPNNSAPWEVARWGRLLSGIVVCLFGALTLLHHPHWLAGTILIAANLILTSLTDRCAMRDTLIKMGAQEREDLFLPGGHERQFARNEK